MAKEGAAIVVNDLGGARDGTGGGSAMADLVVDEVKALGAEGVANYDNVASVEGGEGILKTALDAFGRVDCVINNAGILRDKSFSNTTEELWDPVIAVHLKGTYCVTRPIFNHMKESGSGGVVINTSSTSGLNGNFGQCNYGAAKAGIAGFTRCLAIEGKKYGIRCFILAPAALTRLTEDLPGFNADAMKEKMAPELISPLLTFLASDLSKDMTGNTFFCGGGRIAEMKVVTTRGITKKEEGGMWTPEEVAEAMKPGEILMSET
jgi:NAD(P)-dependent dehydrogenase (short-subunit alcohol dehydrogenase family)